MAQIQLQAHASVFGHFINNHVPSVISICNHGASDHVTSAITMYKRIHEKLLEKMGKNVTFRINRIDCDDEALGADHDALCVPRVKGQENADE